MDIYTIYRATNNVNGKCYVGFDSNWPNRMNAHKKAAFYEKASDYHTYFHRAIRKHGWDSFTWEVLYTHRDGHYTKNNMEYFFIMENDSYNNGYNMTLGGDGTIGLIRTEEHRKKIGDAQRGKSKPKLSEDHKAKITQSAKLSQNRGRFKPGNKKTQDQIDKTASKIRGMRWWNNGNQEIKSFDQPGSEWINGRLPQSRPPSRKDIPAWNKGLKSVKT